MNHMPEVHPNSPKWRSEDRLPFDPLRPAPRARWKAPGPKTTVPSARKGDRLQESIQRFTESCEHVGGFFFEEILLKTCLM